MKVKRLLNMIFLSLANITIPSKKIRPQFVKWGGGEDSRLPIRFYW